MKFKKIDIAFIILLIILSIIAIDFLLNKSHREIIENISKYGYFQELGSGLLITFLVCMIGNLLPVPTPYTFVVCYSSEPFLHINIFIPLFVGFIASLGCLVGEMGGYFVGRGASEIISDERKENLNKYQLYLVEHPKVAPFLLFFFGITPLNDDTVTIPLGLIKYSIKKTIFWMWLGKLGLMLIFAYDILGVCNFLGSENWILSIVTLYFIVIMVYLMLKVNFIELLNKIRKRNVSKEKNTYGDS